MVGVQYDGCCSLSCSGPDLYMDHFEKRLPRGALSLQKTLPFLLLSLIFPSSTFLTPMCLRYHSPKPKRRMFYTEEADLRPLCAMPRPLIPAALAHVKGRPRSK